MFDQIENRRELQNPLRKGFPSGMWKPPPVLKTEILELEQLIAARGLTRRKRRDLRLMKQLKQQLFGSKKKRLYTTRDVFNKKARRMKAVAKKLLWFAGKDFDSLSPEARRAAERLLRSKPAGEILRAWGCEPAPSK